jgi:peptidoglycan/LPS O-acetylase OafA/YrhL
VIPRGGDAAPAAAAGEGQGHGHDPEATPPDVRPRLRHEPALDGLRGLAVVAVVAFHLDRLGGGFLGVDLFFVLSGFLITSLLLTEHRGRGAIDLGRFWVRRARRLLPALLVMLVGVGVLLLAVTEQADRARFRGDALATLGYVANWHRMVADIGYWDIFSVPSPLDHTWSLAIEEQFYVLWPLVAVLVLGRGAGRRFRLGAVAVAGAAVSFALLAVLWAPGDTNRAYYATDTRIGPTLLGAALAAWVAGRPRRDAPPPRRLEAAAVAGVAWMAVCATAVDGQGPSYYRGALASFAVAATVVIVAVTGGPPGPLGRVLAVRPLRALGAVSYGVYLWHWPVIVFLTPERANVRGWALDGLRVAVTLAVAGLSYRFVEVPVRRGALPGRRLVVAGAGATAVTLAVVLVATGGERPATEAAFEDVPVEGSDNPFFLYPDSIPDGATRVMLVGDSGVYHLGPALAEAGEGAGAVVATSPQILCTAISPEGVTRRQDGQRLRREVCHDDRHERWGELADVFEPDVVVYYLANAGGIGTPLLDGEYVSDCDPAYDAYLRDALRVDADIVGRTGARVVFATSPYVASFNPDSVREVDCRNDTFRTVAADRPGTAVLELNEFVASQIAATDVDMFKDPVHFSEEGSRIVSDWLLPEVDRLLSASSEARTVPGS